jgi:putative ABC transport system permease protein
MPVGDDFLEVMGIGLAAGRDFSRRLLTDIGTGYIVNEAFVRTMGWDEPLGKRIALGANSGRVIGVVKDFNFKSLHTAVEPFLMYRLPENLDDVQEIFRPFIQRLLVLNIAGEDIGLTLRMLEGIIAEFDPTHPFELEFIDDSLDQLYTSERQLMRLIAVFAGLCIFIACLGLFGLAAFTTEQRTKEIGIRKVLGASAGEIIMMLAKGTLVLVLAAAFVASGIAYLAIDEWLAGFAYRAPINPLVFVLATALAAVVAYATIALQSYNTARADPVDALRYE